MNLMTLKDYLLIRSSGFFDERYYLKCYPDIRAADVDALTHFVMHGWKEGRNPSERFNTQYYLMMNPDLKSSSCNPLVHYIKTGIKENRVRIP